MTRKSDGRLRQASLPIVCGRCGQSSVRAIWSAARVVIRCDACGARLFAADLDLPGQADSPLDGERLKHVTPPARALYDFIRRYVAQHGYAPTLREMQAGLGWDSPNSATYYLKQLDAVGLIERDYAAARGIRLV